MTKKRFWILNVLTKNSGIKDGDKLLSFDEVVDLLNELFEENKQLKQKNQLLYEDIDFLKRFIEKRGFKAKLESDKK